ncbi:taxifolin 8-monooxygenase [Malassezia sp. CBS 17886]|nr:taxifolin 8-monooxygenase [Malassezia sp. CBS 17886]
MSAPVYDVVGVGFGPANLALCIALHESTARTPDFDMCFLEQGPKFTWHPSLLLPGSQLQVSPLKDLATLRNPTSSYTFVNYLHKVDRLVDYINREEKVPSRREWSAYLAWAAQHMHAYVRYGRRVRDIVPERSRSGVTCFCVISEDVASGATSEVRARNVCIATGGAQQIPRVFQPLWEPCTGMDVSPLVHTSAFLPQMARLGPMLREKAAAPGTPRLRLAVVGGGQSSAEVLCYLHSQFPDADLDMLVRASALVPSDSSSFVNSAAFDPSSVSTFWESSARDRRAQLAEFKRTNYSVVRNDLLSALYEIVYDQRIEFDDPYAAPKGVVRILTNKELLHADLLPTRQVRIDSRTVAGEQAAQSNVYDAVFLGTGFCRDASSLPFVQSLAPHFPLLSRDGAAKLRETELAMDNQAAPTVDANAQRGALRGITRDYRLVAEDTSEWHAGDGEPRLGVPPAVLQYLPGSRFSSDGSPPSSINTSDDSGYTSTNSSPGRTRSPAVYVFGCNEYTHGLSDSLMSIVAHRAGIVSTALLARMDMK